MRAPWFFHCIVLLCATRVCDTALPASCLESENEGNLDLDLDETYPYPLCDERTHVETFYITIAGSYITRTTGTISTIASAFIIVIIFRSDIRLSSVYHRLMFGMSCADIVTSVTIALNTLPMPRDTIYNFAGATLGNTATCAAQGFFFFFGANATAAYNCALCIYYLCSIRFKMRERQISRRIEPVLHALCILFTLPLSILIWSGELYNPTPFDAWCTGEPYPWWCNFEDGKECTIRGKINEFTKWIRLYLITIFAIETLVIILSMVIIVWFVYRQEQLLNRVTRHVIRRGRRLSEMGHRRLDASRERHKFTKLMLIQASAYIAAFFICQSNVIMSLLIRRKPPWMQVYHLVTRPLQGLFNLIIFVVHKAHDLRLMQPSLTFRQAIWKVIRDKGESHVIISHISLVDIDTNNDDDGLVFDGVDDNDDDDEEEEEEESSSDDLSSQTPDNRSRNIILSKGAENGNSNDSRSQSQSRNLHGLTSITYPSNDHDESFVDDNDVSLESSKQKASNASRYSLFSSIGSMFSYVSGKDMSDVVSSEGVLRSEDSNIRWD